MSRNPTKDKLMAKLDAMENYMETLDAWEHRYPAD